MNFSNEILLLVFIDNNNNNIQSKHAHELSANIELLSNNCTVDKYDLVLFVFFKEYRSDGYSELIIKYINNFLTYVILKIS